MAYEQTSGCGSLSIVPRVQCGSVEGDIQCLSAAGSHEVRRGQCTHRVRWEHCTSGRARAWTEEERIVRVSVKVYMYYEGIIILNHICFIKGRTTFVTLYFMVTAIRDFVLVRGNH